MRSIEVLNDRQALLSRVGGVQPAQHGYLIRLGQLPSVQGGPARDLLFRLLVSWDTDVILSLGISTLSVQVVS